MTSDITTLIWRHCDFFQAGEEFARADGCPCVCMAGGHVSCAICDPPGPTPPPLGAGCMHEGRFYPVRNRQLHSPILVAVWLSVGHNPESKVHGANMGPIWGRQGPGGPHVRPMNSAIWEDLQWAVLPVVRLTDLPLNKMAAISQTTFFKWTSSILTKISLTFIPKGPIDYALALV